MSDIIDNKLKKTKICNFWKINKCKFMDNSELCDYAHGENELICHLNEICDDNNCKKKHINKNNENIKQKKENDKIIENLYYDEYDGEIYFYNEEVNIYTKDKYIKEMEELITLIKSKDLEISNIFWELQINQIKTLKKIFKNYNG